MATAAQWAQAERHVPSQRCLKHGTERMPPTEMARKTTSTVVTSKRKRMRPWTSDRTYKCAALGVLFFRCHSCETRSYNQSACNHSIRQKMSNSRHENVNTSIQFQNRSAKKFQVSANVSITPKPNKQLCSSSNPTHFKKAYI